MNDDELIAAAVEALKRKAGIAARSLVTLRMCVERWADTHRRLPSFACDYARALFVCSWAPADGPFAGVQLGDRDVATLTPEDVDLYRSWRYGTTTRRKGPPTAATVNREVMMVKRPLNWAVKRRTIAANPIEGLEDEDEDDARAVVIEEEGFQAILKPFGTDRRMRALTTLGYDSGMRKTELLLSRRSWMDPIRGYVHIPGAVAKNGEARVTDLTARAWAEIEALPRHIGTDLIFANPDTADPYGGRWIHQLFVDAVDASGVVGRDGNKPRLHDLRRSWITLASRRGVPDSVIMSKSGHKDHKVFTRYRIVSEKDLKQSRDDMERGRQEDIAALEARRDPHRAPAGNTEHVRKRTTP
ncbi:MAG TPA: tyrosine-type recombinase/integrase [Mycobacterium sp.]|nr:tyrosine-type recombinase/integrase [Mycobacterium sp.]